MSKILNLSHGSDLDGQCSAAVVAHYAQLGMQEYQHIPFEYDDAVPYDQIDKDVTVVLTDISVPQADIDQLAQQAEDVVWIDHHKTAIEALDSSIKGMRDSGNAACELAWEYFFPAVPMPLGVLLLGRYDVWDHADPRVLPFQYGARVKLMPLAPDHDSWHSLLDRHTTLEKQILDFGHIAKETMDSLYVQVMKASCRATLDGLTVIVVPGRWSSQVCESIQEDTDDAILTYRWDGAKKRWNYSIYALRLGVDVSKIATAHGGGGHVGAAGFSSPLPVSELVS